MAHHTTSDQVTGAQSRLVGGTSGAAAAYHATTSARHEHIDTGEHRLLSAVQDPPTRTSSAASMSRP
jgi:hypothetical protein